MNTTETNAEAPTRPVTNGEVFAFAKKRCKWCLGSGQKRIARKAYRAGPKDAKGNPTAIQVPITKDTPTEAAICGCALQRFMGANGSKVEITGDAMCWKAPVADNRPDSEKLGFGDGGAP
jgi:hypothetical protein